MKKSQYILLSLDVEEFDLPLEYDLPVPMERQLSLGKMGWDAVEPLINAADLRTTLFTTANFAVHYPGLVKKMAERHELASHAYYHGSFQPEDLESSRIKLEEIAGEKVLGLRMPRMRKVTMEAVKNAGYTYDSSLNPTWIPGRYNNLGLPRTLYLENGIQRLPTSVSPHLRIPLFWLAFKNLPYSLFKLLAIQTLRKDGYLCLYFHPWEFMDLSVFKIPAYLKRPDGPVLQEKLNRLIRDLGKEGSFITIRDFIGLPDGSRTPAASS